MSEAAELCQLCGQPLESTLLSPAAHRKLEGSCRRGECARERTIARDADGHVAHDRVAPATAIAFVGAPRLPRFAR